MCPISIKRLSSAKTRRKNEYSAFWLNSKCYKSMWRSCHTLLDWPWWFCFFARSLHLPAEKCASFCSVPEFPASFPTSSKLRSVTLQLRCVLEAPRWFQGNCWNKPRISQVGICSFKLMITGQMSETAIAYYLFYWAAYCGKQIPSAYRNPLGRALLSLWGQHRRFALCCSHLRNSSIWHTCGCEPIAILEEQCCCLKFFEIFETRHFYAVPPQCDIDVVYNKYILPNICKWKRLDFNSLI